MKYRFAVPLYCVCFLLQSTFLSACPIRGVSADLLLLLTMLIPLCYGGLEAVVLGAAFGLLKDIGFGVVIGPSALLYATIGAGWLLLRRVVYGEKAFAIPLALTASTAFYTLANWLLLRALRYPYAFSVAVRRFPMFLAWELTFGLLLYWAVGRRAFRYPQDRQFRA